MIPVVMKRNCPWSAAEQRVRREVKVGHVKTKSIEKDRIIIVGLRSGEKDSREYKVVLDQ